VPRFHRLEPTPFWAPGRPRVGPETFTADNQATILVGKDTQMPDLMVMLITFGGLALFGAVGFVIGPVIASLFLAVWKIYGKTFGEVLEAETAAPAGHGDSPDDRSHSCAVNFRILGRNEHRAAGRRSRTRQPRRRSRSHERPSSSRGRSRSRVARSTGWSPSGRDARNDLYRAEDGVEVSGQRLPHGLHGDVDVDSDHDIARLNQHVV